jgi:hypothetical protein
VRGIFFLPQRPFFTNGSLREQVFYPALPPIGCNPAEDQRILALFSLTDLSGTDTELYTHSARHFLPAAAACGNRSSIRRCRNQAEDRRILALFSLTDLSGAGTAQKQAFIPFLFQ